MKINDQLISALNQGSPTNQTLKDDFERLLQSPTQQHSGDEYYWLHQDQLQQSALRFNVIKMTKQQSEPSITPHQKMGHQMSIQTQLNDMPNPRPTHQDRPVDNKIIPAPSTPIKPDVNNKRVEFTPKTVSNPLSQKIQLNTINQVNAPKEIIDTSKKQPITWKNHHLFIHDNEAEVTLNLQELDTNEQKKLIQFMKNTLKQKGLALSQLIINGVRI